jgi:hypothetical protein
MGSIMSVPMEDSQSPAVQPAEPVSARQEEALVYCPVCSTRLTGRKCKLVCEKCGYYMSCADYY